MVVVEELPMPSAQVGECVDRSTVGPDLWLPCQSTQKASHHRLAHSLSRTGISCHLPSRARPHFGSPNRKNNLVESETTLRFT